MFTVYSKPACPFCDQAKMLLTSKGLAYEEKILDVGQPKLEGKQYVTKEQLLAAAPGARTVPQILDGNELIGGFTELKQWLTVAAETREAIKAA